MERGDHAHDRVDADTAREEDGPGESGAFFECQSRGWVDERPAHAQGEGFMEDFRGWTPKEGRRGVAGGILDG